MERSWRFGCRLARKTPFVREEFRNPRELLGYWTLGLGRAQEPRIGLTALDRGGRRWRDHKLADRNNSENTMSDTALPLWN